MKNSRVCFWPACAILSTRMCSPFDDEKRERLNENDSDSDAWDSTIELSAETSMNVESNMVNYADTSGR